MATLFYGYQAHPYYPYFKTMFLFDPQFKGDTRFRHSYIKNNLEDVRFGDKPVRHRRMEGNVKPTVLTSEQPLPWDPEDSYTYVDYIYRYVYQWSMGINSSQTYESCTAKQGRWGAWFNIVRQAGFRFYSKGDGCVYYQYGTYTATGSDAASRVEAADAGSIFIEDWGPETLAVDERGHVHSWPISQGPFRFGATYELHDPRPYYWADYMEDIYPHQGDAEALSEVIRNTISSATRLEMNNYANIIELASTVKDVLSVNIGDLVRSGQKVYKTLVKEIHPSRLTGKSIRSAVFKAGKSAGDAWLKYRYLYNTTKADVEEYVSKVVQREKSLYEDLSPDQVLRGQINVQAGTCRVKMRLHPDPFAGFDRMLANADKVGLFPGLYNLWDMIPFSFVADWFSDLGGVLEDIDQSFYFRYYKVDELLVTYKKSLARDELWGLTNYLWYDRSQLSAMPQWEVYRENETSGKVVSYRALDLASLCVGVL